MTSGARQHERESAMAIVSVVLLMIIITMVVGLLAMHLSSQARSSSRQAQRASAMDVAGAGVQALQQALVVGRNADTASATQADGFSIDAASLELAAKRTGGELVPNSSLPYRDVGTGGMSQSIQGPKQADGSRQYWQVLQALPPAAGFPYLTLYVRGWRVSSSGTITDASVVKARLKPGSMADFQLLSDVPIVLDNNAQINGRVHSNGGTDEWSQVPGDDLNQRIWSTGSVSCTQNGGVTPVVSTARGTISLPTAAGCSLQPGTGDYVPLDAGRDSVVRIRARASASAADVREFASTDTSSTPATAVIGATSVRVTYPGKTAQTVNTPRGTPMTLVFDRDVQVSSTANTQARLTIAAWTGTVKRSAPSIIIAGNVGRADPVDGYPHALGLLAEGDIIVDPSLTGTNTTIQAAIMSTTGGVRLPWRYRTPVRVTEPANFYPPQRGTLTIVGSIASHSSIAMRWSWGSSDWIGWTTRSYSWDSWLATYPPPYWPASNPWEIVDQTEADADCYGATRNTTYKAVNACR